MKCLILCAILFCAIVVPAIAELTSQDLDKIRLIIKEEIKAEIESSEKRMKEYIDVKIESVNKQFGGVDTQFGSVNKQFEGVDKQFAGIDKQITHVTYLTYGLIALIAAAIGIPQIIMAWRSGKDREQERINQELRQEIEALKQQRIISP